jgi:hypothetical protein
MHEALLNMAVPEGAVAGMHTVVTDDVPQDSDVFLVLVRRPAKPEIIGTEHYNYQIFLNGTIDWRVAKRTP